MAFILINPQLPSFSNVSFCCQKEETAFKLHSSPSFPPATSSIARLLPISAATSGSPRAERALVWVCASGWQAPRYDFLFPHIRFIMPSDHPEEVKFRRSREEIRSTDPRCGCLWRRPRRRASRMRRHID